MVVPFVQNETKDERQFTRDQTQGSCCCGCSRGRVIRTEEKADTSGGDSAYTQRDHVDQTDNIQHNTCRSQLHIANDSGNQGNQFNTPPELQSNF